MRFIFSQSRDMRTYKHFDIACEKKSILKIRYKNYLSI